MSQRKSESTHKILRHENHARPVTRRDFLAQGSLAFGASLFLPTLPALLGSNRAWGQDDLEMAADPLPLLIFDLAGGAGLPANFLVGGPGGPEDLLPSYDTLGWNPRDGGSIDRSFGLPMSARASKILEGMVANASAEARARLRMGSLCNFSRDDTSANLLSTMSVMIKSSPGGALFASGLATVGSVSGGNSGSIDAGGVIRPLNVQSLGDILDSVSYGQAFNVFGEGDMRRMGEAMLANSLEQGAQYGRDPRNSMLLQLVEEGLKKNMGLGALAAALDPRTDAMASQIYGINANTGARDANAVKASIVMNVLKGASRAGVITIGGCDYHDGTQTTGDAKDREIGNEIGRAVELAHRLKKAFFFQVITDGGVYAKRGTRVWQGDAGDKSMTILGCYSPDQPVAMRRFQVGSYTTGQGVFLDSTIGSQPARAAYASFANYMSVSGRLGEFAAIARGVFTPTELDSVLMFG